MRQTKTPWTLVAATGLALLLTVGSSVRVDALTGAEAMPPESFRFIAYVGDDYGYCTGAIIAPTWVVTAAHCVVKGDGSTIRPDEIGDLSRGWPNDDWERVPVKRVVSHPRYYWQGDGFRNDVALLETARPFVSSGMVPIQVLGLEDEARYAADGTTAVLIGYGEDENGQRDRDGLFKVVSAPIYHAEACRTEHSFVDGRGEIVHEGTICAGDRNRGIRSGDSGGPLLVETEDGAYGLVGIASISGHDRSGHPVVAVYTRVATVKDWIDGCGSGTGECVAGGVSLPEMKLHAAEELHKLTSQPATKDTPSTAIVFVNQTAEVISFHWLDYNRREMYYGSVEPGETVDQHTFPGHVWTIKDAQERTFAVVVGEPETRRATVTADMLAGAVDSDATQVDVAAVHVDHDASGWTRLPDSDFPFTIHFDPSNNLDAEVTPWTWGGYPQGTQNRAGPYDGAWVVYEEADGTVVQVSVWGSASDPPESGAGWRLRTASGWGEWNVGTGRYRIKTSGRLPRFTGPLDAEPSSAAMIVQAAQLEVPFLDQEEPYISENEWRLSWLLLLHDEAAGMQTVLQCWYGCRAWQRMTDFRGAVEPDTTVHDEQDGDVIESETKPGDTVTGLSWESANRGHIPESALVAGRGAHGENLFICRAEFEGGIHPGKISHGMVGCAVPWGSREHLLDHYDILLAAIGDRGTPESEPGFLTESDTVSIVSWESADRGRIPQSAVVAGREAHGESLFICRAEFEGGIHPGKIYRTGNCLVPGSGLENHMDQYEVLVCVSDSGQCVEGGVELDDEETEDGIAVPIEGMESLEPIALGQAPHPRSEDCCVDTGIVFDNRTEAEISYHWINYEGQEVEYGRVGPSDMAYQHTFASHVWMVKDVRGTVLGLFRAKDTPARAVVTGGSIRNELSVEDELPRPETVMEHDLDVDDMPMIDISASRLGRDRVARTLDAALEATALDAHGNEVPDWETRFLALELLIDLIKAGFWDMGGGDDQQDRRVDRSPSETNIIAEPTRVPKTVRDTFNLDPFYQQWIDVGGLPVVASATVNSYAIREAAWLITQMIGHRADVLRALAQNRVRFAVMAHDELTTDIPEHSDLVPAGYWDRRARGLGPTPQRPATSSGEENLLSYHGDPYWSESILIHEFSHAIHEMALNTIEPEFDDRLGRAFDEAVRRRLWRGTYAITNKEEYWAEGAQSWFDANRENDDEHNHVNTREELKTYDPPLAALLTQVFGDGDWRYTPVRERTHLLFLQGYDPRTSPRFEWPSELPDLAERQSDLLNPDIDRGADWKDLERFDPDRLHNPRSMSSRVETAIIFVNGTEGDVSYHWIDFNGKEVHYGDVGPGGSANQHTFASHVWVVKDAHGKPLAVFRAENGTRRALVCGGCQFKTIGPEAAVEWDVVEWEGSGFDELCSHIQRGDLEEIDRIVEAGANLNARFGDDTAVYCARAPRVLRHLVEEHGADPNGRVRDGEHLDTPLCKARTREIAHQFVRLGALIRGRGDGSQSLLQCAGYYGREIEHFDYLIDELGADVNEVTSSGTALCMAAAYQEPEVVAALLDRGADPNLAGRSGGQHPLECASRNRKASTISDMLKAAGAVMPE